MDIASSDDEEQLGSGDAPTGMDVSSDEEESASILSGRPLSLRLRGGGGGGPEVLRETHGAVSCRVFA